MPTKNLKKVKRTPAQPKNSFSGGVKKVQRNSKKELDKLQRLAKSKIKSFSQTASKEMGYAKDELAELEDKAKDYIKKHPEKLFMAAAGIGAFVGALTATLIKRKKGRRRK